MYRVIKQKKYLILAAIVTALLVLSLGYFFATQKTEPVYMSKIDRIMFERKNKAPKVIITLPDRSSKTIANREPEAQTEAIADAGKAEKKLMAIDFLERVPLTAKLTPRTNPVPLELLEIDPNLSEEVGGQVLPIIAASGDKPWIEYGKSVEIQPKFYKVGVVIKNLGLDSMVSNAAIDSMPADISLAFSPYGQDQAQLIKNARRFGHETYVDLLLSSKNFLKADSGPLAMSITQDLEGNMSRVRQSLNVKAPIGGMIINSGIADEDTKEQLTKILEKLRNRGLLIIDATEEDGVAKVKVDGLARKKADIVIEDNYKREIIDQQLKKAEQIARHNGSVLVVVNPKPVVLHALTDWINSFSPQVEYEQARGSVGDKPFVLVPISNLVVE